MSDRSRTLSVSPSPPPKPPGPPAAYFRAIRVIARTPMSSMTLCLPREMLASSSSDLRASLVVVVMNINCAVLRGEFSELDARDEVLSSHFSGDAATSWICVRPAGGPLLAEFAGKMKRVPGWMVAHILLGVISEVDDGEEVAAGDVLLDMRRGDEKYAYRDYPIVRVDAKDAADEEKAARSVLELMRHVIEQWSDSAPYIAFAGRVGQKVIVTDEPVLLLLPDITRMLETDVVAMEHVVEEFEGKLVDMRHEGPMQMPARMVQNLHVKLVTEEEVKWAFREPVVFKFTWYFEKVQAIVTNKKLRVGSGGCAGMKTKRILVARFSTKKDAFLWIVGEGGYADTEAEADDELTMPEGESEDGQFDWDDEMMMD